MAKQPVKLPDDLETLIGLHKELQKRLSKGQPKDDEVQLLWDIAWKINMIQQGKQPEAVSELKKNEEDKLKRFDAWTAGKSFNDCLTEEEKAKRALAVDEDGGL